MRKVCIRDTSVVVRTPRSMTSVITLRFVATFLT
jgi:hypothetical protein